MRANTLSPCITTDKIEATRDFYIKHLNAKVTFDCGWYVNLCIGSDGPAIQFMSPQGEDMPSFNEKGVTLNFKVDDVDAEYARLTRAGLDVVMPLEDHPWGDRGFSVTDPIGISLYIYSDREPSEEFRAYFKE